MDYLLKVVEDPNAQISRRVDALRCLQRYADSSHLPRLEKLMWDKTPVPSDNVPYEERESDMPKLGEYVRRCIKRISGDRPPLNPIRPR